MGVHIMAELCAVLHRGLEGHNHCGLRLVKEMDVQNGTPSPRGGPSLFIPAVATT